MKNGNDVLSVSGMDAKRSAYDSRVILLVGITVKEDAAAASIVRNAFIVSHPASVG